MAKIIESIKDERDYLATDILDYSAELPETYIAPNTKVRCQWFSSQCVCYACTQAMSQNEVLKNNKYNIYSPGLVYANRESDDYQGEGWYIRKALKQLNKFGTCLEKDFPYPDSYEEERKKFLADKDTLLAKAEKYKIKNYFRCKSEEDIKRCIIQRGSVITSSRCNIWFFWLSRITKKQYSFKGSSGHAYIIVGWDKDGWIIQDSYSWLRPLFGKAHISYDYPFIEFWGLTINDNIM